MNNTRIRVVFFLAALLLSAITLPSRGEEIVALTTANTLLKFDSATPGIVGAPISITGLLPDETLYDIDFRPADRKLYAIGSSNQVYRIDSLGAATAVSTLSVALDSSLHFGIDFNPAVDRLRIVSPAGQNLRANVDTGATLTDTPLNGAATGADSVAYTNPDTDPNTGTALFYIGSGSPANLFNTANPNGGVLALVGSLGANSTLRVGFDISRTAIAYASLTDAQTFDSTLYTIDLATGAAAPLGVIDSGLFSIAGIATQPVPEPGTLLLGAIGGAIAALAARRRVVAKRQA